MSLYLPPEIWLLILKYASGFPRQDILLRGQHLQATLRPSGIALDNATSAPIHDKTCSACVLHRFDQCLLANTCLVAKQCHDTAASLLYRDPLITARNGGMSLLRTLVRRPDLAAHVRWLPLLEFGEAEEEASLPETERLLPTAFLQRYDEHASRSGQLLALDRPASKGLDAQTCITTILSFLPELRKTVLSHHIGPVVPGLLPDSLPNLTEVELSHVPSIYDDMNMGDLLWLSKAAPNIDTLTIKDLVWAEDDPGTSIDQRPLFPNVTCLCLVNSLMSGGLFNDFITSFPRIEQLDFLRPRIVFFGSEFTHALVQHAPQLRDLRVQFVDQRRDVMRFDKDLARMKGLQRLWLPFSCFVLDREEFNPDDVVQMLPSSLQHLSMVLSLTVEDLMSETLKAIASQACEPDSHLPDLRSVTVSGWDFDVGSSGPTSRSFVTEEAMAVAGRAMDRKGVRLLVEGGVASLRDNFMGFERVVRRYSAGDGRETGKDEDLMKGHNLGEWGTLARWGRRRRS